MAKQGLVNRVNWYQAIAEVALIAVGVLIALAVDSWWEDRTMRAAELEYLHSLHADFEANRLELIQQVQEEEQLIALGKQFHKHISSGFSDVTPSELNELVGKFYMFYSWTPITGTYDDMVGSGRLLYLQNATLRSKLSQYGHLLDSVDEYERAEFSDWYLEQSPFLRQYLNVSSFGWIENYRPDFSFEPDLEALQSQEFHNLVSTWMVSHQDVIGNYKGAIESGDEFISLIETEIDLTSPE